MREGGGAGYDLAHAQVAAGQNCGIARRRHADDASKSDGSEMQRTARGMRVRENALGGLQHVEVTARLLGEHHVLQLLLSNRGGEACFQRAVERQVAGSEA